MSAVRKVRCPQCGEDSLWAPENPHRPFCSLRCKQIDLGCWASDEYRIPVAPDNNDLGCEIPDAASHA
ncbi:MAG: DNA gyrase inhibitor YacG [Rhodocyclaceae bacterium]|nr:DNA gyrase inhibitor YacG [Rhodocyclaceae bacterium]